jgi:hypothetical protein
MIYIVLMLCNFLIGLFGLSLLILGIYLWATIKVFNSFVFSFIILFMILTFIFILGCYVRASPTSLLIYFIMNLLITIIVVIFTFFLLIDKEKIVDFLISNMEDSKDEIREKFNKNFEAIKILFLSFVIVFVIRF